MKKDIVSKPSIVIAGKSGKFGMVSSTPPPKPIKKDFKPTKGKK